MWNSFAEQIASAGGLKAYATVKILGYLVRIFFGFMKRICTKTV